MILPMNEHYESKVSEVIEKLGGPVNAATTLGAPSYQAVQSWEKSGQIPAKHCPKAEEETGISRKNMRPDWMHIWPDLVKAA
jgi:DNA-binding transcriptional regulator YdaS (Cro superfamily)